MPQYLYVHSVWQVLTYMAVKLHTKTRIKVGHDGNQNEDDKMESLFSFRPVLRVLRGVGWLWP